MLSLPIIFAAGAPAGRLAWPLSPERLARFRRGAERGPAHCSVVLQPHGRWPLDVAASRPRRPTECWLLFFLPPLLRVEWRLGMPSTVSDPRRDLSPPIQRTQRKGARPLPNQPRSQRLPRTARSISRRALFLAIASRRSNSFFPLASPNSTFAHPPLK